MFNDYNDDLAEIRKQEAIAWGILLLTILVVVTVVGIIVKCLSVLLNPNASEEEKRKATIVLITTVGAVALIIFAFIASKYNATAIFYEIIKSHTASVILFTIFTISALSTLIATVFYTLLYRKFRGKADLVKATFSALVFFIALYFAFAIGVSSNGLALFGKDSELALKLYSGHLGTFYTPYTPSWGDEVEEYVFVKGDEIAPYMKQSFIVKINELSRKKTKQIQYVKEQIIPFSKENYHVVKIKEYKEKEGKVIFQIADTAKYTKYIPSDKNFIAPASVFKDKQRYTKKTIFKIPEATLFIALAFMGIAFHYTVEAFKRVSEVGKMMEALKTT